MTALTEIQSKTGVTADGTFGPKTAKAIQAYFKLTPEQAAHFLAQVSHETGEFKVFTENLNYSADGLRKTFLRYFPSMDLANQYARDPEAIANRVYGKRMGNGDESTGDGWKYRGRGALQLTGKSNYDAFAKFLGVTSLDPNDVATKYAFESAKWFFDRNDLWNLCVKVDTPHITVVTKRVNGGVNGLAHRIELTNKYYGWLK